MPIIKDLLNSPSLYLFSQAVLGAKRARQRWIREYAQPKPGMRVLDIGCGPAYVVDYLPQVCYCGFDISARYIAYARRKYGSLGQFYCQRFDSEMAKRLEPFDLVLMAGLLHHLNDQDLLDLLKASKQSMKAGGSLVTLDPCYDAGQPPIAKFLLDRDRGESIRTKTGYSNLALAVFDQIELHVRSDLFSLPYTALIMTCRP